LVFFQDDTTWFGSELPLNRRHILDSICFFFQDDTTWFGSELPLNRRHILDSIEQKTKADYEQEHAEQREQYQRAKSAWPHVTEYSDKFVLGTRVQQQQKTEYVKKDRSHQDSNLESPAP